MTDAMCDVLTYVSASRRQWSLSKLSWKTPSAPDKHTQTQTQTLAACVVQLYWRWRQLFFTDLSHGRLTLSRHCPTCIQLQVSAHGYLPTRRTSPHFMTAVLRDKANYNYC